MMASAPSGTAQVSFSMGAANSSHPQQQSFLTVDHVRHSDTYNPLDPQWKAPFRPGGTAWVHGRYFPSDFDLNLGVYRGFGQFEYLDTLRVHTNEEGSFAIQIQINPSYPTGKYAVIPITFLTEDSDEESRSGFGRFSILAEETRQTAYPSCDNLHWSSLSAGGRAYLADDTTSNLRMYPGLYADVSGKLRPGEEVNLLEGPYCEDEYNWWYVHVINSGLLGWTVEGDDQNAWLVALP